MNEVSSFENKQICFDWLKKWILICQNTKSVLWYVEKKVVFGDKNSYLCCDDKKMIFNDRKIRSVFIVKKK